MGSSCTSATSTKVVPVFYNMNLQGFLFLLSLFLLQKLELLHDMHRPNTYKYNSMHIIYTNFTYRQSVDKYQLKVKALQLFRESGQEGQFTASSGWINKFLKQNQISNRRFTGHAQKIPAGASVFISAFLQQCQDVIKANGK